VVRAGFITGALLQTVLTGAGGGGGGKGDDERRGRRKEMDEVQGRLKDKDRNKEISGKGGKKRLCDISGFSGLTRSEIHHKNPDKLHICTNF